MHKVINNPDINEFDLNEALGVFFNRTLLETFSIWECRDDKWMREKSKNVLILWILFVWCVRYNTILRFFVIKLHVIFI